MRVVASRQQAGRSQRTRYDLVVNRPSAITLFELLLVLVLLVIIGSLAAPLFESSFSSIRLRRATDQVLATWSQARTHAIEAGVIYQFRFEPAGNLYQVTSWSGGLESDLPETSHSNNGSKLDQSLANPESSPAELELARWKLEATLPETIVFSTAESVSADQLGERTVTRLDQGQTTTWSAPILFYPDGTTSTASLLLQSSQGLYRRATLRALTGVARASEVLSRDEVDRLHTR